MGETQAPAIGEDARAAVLGTELRTGRASSIVGIFIMSAVLVFVMTSIRPLAARPWTIDLWVGAMAAVLVVLAGMVGIGLVHSPSRPVGPYIRLGALIQTTMSMLIVVSVWILLPPSGADLRALMLMMYVWYIATVVAASSAAVPVPARDIVLLTLSIVAWVLWDRPPYWGAWAVFIGMAGATMLAFRKLIRRAVVAAIEARVESEAAAATTRAALARAEAARDAKTRFIASASHDLQQPLQAAHLYFEAAVETGDAARRVRAIAGARAAFASTSGLIGTMLDHLRLEAGAVRARPEPVALGPLIREIAAEHEPAARAAGMRLRVVPTRRIASADAALLRRSLGNLVANAVRHAGGEYVLIGVRRREGTLTIWVIDDGKGIAADDAERLFEDYEQGEAAGPGGFGLGLASVRRSLVLMDGAAGFEPRWTGGAAFWLRLQDASGSEGQLSQAA